MCFFCAKEIFGVFFWGFRGEALHLWGMRKCTIKRGLLWFVFLAGGLCARGQDTKVSHPFMWKSFNNPGYTGFDGMMRTSLGLQRSYWTHPLEFRSYFAAFDYPFRERRTFGLGGLSVLYQRDREGALSYTTDMLGVSLSGRVKLAHHTVLQAGLQPTVYRKGVDPTRITLGDQLDPFYGQILDVSPEMIRFYADKIWMFDMSAGIYGETDFNVGWHGLASLEYGFSVYHIIESTQSFLSEHGSKSSEENMLNRRFSGYLSYAHPIAMRRMNTVVSPYLLMDFQSVMKNVHFGVSWEEERFGMIGLGLKTDRYDGLKLGTLLVHLGVNLRRGDEMGWKVGYTYEVPTHQGTMYKNTTHSVSLHWYVARAPKRCVNRFDHSPNNRNMVRRAKGTRRGIKKAYNL